MPTKAPARPAALRDEDIRLIADALRRRFSAEAFDFAERLTRLAEEGLRFAPFAALCRATREARGLDLKAAAKALKVPQYVVHGVEEGSLGEMELRHLERYVDFLGLRDAFEEWKAANPALYTRLSGSPVLGRPGETLEHPLLGRLMDPTQFAAWAAAATGPPPFVKAVPGDTRMVFRLKVTLQGSKPPIWRRMLVAGGASLHELHHVLQGAMGWTDTHLYEFEVRGARFTDPDASGEGLEPGEHDSRKVRLGELGLGAGQWFRYRYDFGDDWAHRIEIERVAPPEPGQKVPACLGGARSCPPEDCGGIFGYQEMLGALRDPSHAEHGTWKEWSGGKFDPEAFDAAETDRLLGRMVRRTRRT